MRHASRNALLTMVWGKQIFGMHVKESDAMPQRHADQCACGTSLVWSPNEAYFNETAAVKLLHNIDTRFTGVDCDICRVLLDAALDGQFIDMLDNQKVWTKPRVQSSEENSPAL